MILLVNQDTKNEINENAIWVSISDDTVIEGPDDSESIDIDDLHVGQDIMVWFFSQLFPYSGGMEELQIQIIK
jgi:hypothetical protein